MNYIPNLPTPLNYEQFRALVQRAKLGDLEIPEDPLLATQLFIGHKIYHIYDIQKWDFDYFNFVRDTSLKLTERLEKIMSANADIWVRERRLRPVYELLDAGNNKKVVTEVDKLLKKQPQFTCAKVLKALALIRLNKVEEADVILEPIHKEVPTDDGTIQALSICYRELERPAALCSFLEAAIKKEQSEELLTHCFMAQVRVSEYQKQHKTAMQLFKAFNKPSYFYWAIASLIIKYEQTEGPTKEDITPKLAERMIEKFIAEQKVPLEDVLVQLYVTALEMQGNYEKMIEILRKYGHPQPTWSNNEFHRLYCHALKKLDRMDELFEYMKATFFKCPEEYDVLKQMIIMFGKTHSTWMQDLLDHLIKNHPSRVVALADLYYSFEHLPIQAMAPRVEVDLEMAIRYGADKPSFCSDIADYHIAFSKVDLDYFLTLLEVDAYDSVNNIIKDVNYEVFTRSISPDISFMDRLMRANRCFGKYLMCEEAMKSLRTEDNMRTKESDFFDQLIIVAASCLMCELNQMNSPGMDYPKYIMENLSDWASISKLTPALKEFHQNLYADDPEDENVPVQEFNGKYMSQSRVEYLLLLAATLLEYGLERSQHNYSLRILLAKVYSRFGANLQAIKLIQGLDLKHIQWDTLGYLVFQEAITSGLYTEASKMLASAESMYTSYKKESMEHVITCYKYNSFSKVGEFLSFRDQIFASTQYKMVLVERRLMDILVNAQTPSDMKKICEIISRDLEVDTIMNNPFGDNRDFTVLEAFAEETSLEQLKKATANMNVQYLKVRASCMFLLTKIVAHAPHYEDCAEKISLLSVMRSFGNILKTWSGVIDAYSDHLKDSQHLTLLPLFHGYWPPTCMRYQELGTWQWVHDMVVYILQVVSTEVPNEENREPPTLDKLATMLDEAMDQVLRHLRNVLPENQMDNIDILEIERAIEKAHYAVESFSFFRMILMTGIVLSKEKFDQWKPTSTKKKGRAKSTDHKKSRSICLQNSMVKYRELHSFVTALQNSLASRSYEKFESSQAAWKTLLKPSFLYSAFPTHHDQLLKNIKESHDHQMKEIVKSSSSLIEFVRCLQP